MKITKLILLGIIFELLIINKSIGQCTFSEMYSSPTGWGGSGFSISGGTLNYIDGGLGIGGCALAGGTPYIFKPAYPLGATWVCRAVAF